MGLLSPSARSRFSPSADGGAPTPSRGSIRAWIPGIGTMRSGLSRSIPLSVFAAVSFAIEYARTIAREVDGVTLHALPLERIIVTKRATNRPKDLALLPILEATLLAKKASPQTD